MVLPIAIGIGVTLVALTGKAVAASVTRFRRLSPQMIATLNKIRLEPTVASDLSQTSQLNSHIKYLRSRFNNAGFRSPMTETEALLVLGIEANEIPNLTVAMLRLRYRKLMVMNHPDRSGSVYISQKINQAKEILEKSYLVKK